MTVDNTGLLRSILKDRTVKEETTEEFAGIKYQTWVVEPNIWADQVERLLENGFMLSIHGLVVRISKQLPSSPEQIRINKQFWTELNIHTRSYGK